MKWFIHKMTVVCFFLILLIQGAGAGAGAEEVQRPNILFILADDLGYETLGCYGGQFVPTPSINQLAFDGLRFDRCYTSPVCTPSRMSIYTGQYAVHHGYRNVLPVHLGTRQFVDFEKRPTYAQQLRKAGYFTAVTGKWQLATLEYHPLHCQVAGFDSWCVWQIWREGAKTTRYWNPCLNQDGKIRDDIADRFGPDVLADYVIDMMKAAVARDQPFCIHHNMLLPHWPIVSTPLSDPERQEPSLEEMVVYLDQIVGRLAKAVRDLGIAENTYIIFMGDNGTDSPVPRQTATGLVRGGKTDLNDAGTHVPLIFCCPERIEAGTVSSALVDAADLFPTFCQLAKIEIHSLETDGHSLVPVLEQKQNSVREFVTASYGNDHIVFDGQYRLHSLNQTIDDCRDLYREKPLDPKSTEYAAAYQRLGPIMQSLLEGR